MQLCYSENAVNYLKKILSYSKGDASHVVLGAEGDVRPPATIQQHYTCIRFQMAYQLVGWVTTFFCNKNCRRAK